ncbi:DNA-binding transcriptional regulator, LysR family [Pseudoxanthomonas sp. GM95]|uniref:LysR substrate-binding domain-containing protein n=1 Tax=Pseudoxanthomonas sp. GM95 TaxID=1881043 RepID=UPI0008AF30C7|nr:LysR substrate-binding domain-containing protein [Pseudoxanthomonas sp. GM95]SEL58899.1 DNA-binding transcriptional regulator, LysR family [Pseudoxanthomonas sp. GM95]
MDAIYALNVRHLDALLQVARLGNISLAAGSVSLSQPALAQAIGKLEQVLQARLFDRHPGGVTATEAGARFIDRTRRALRYLERGVQQIRRPARLPSIHHVERRVTMSQLRALVSVVSASSYAGAAAQTGLSQPSLHRAMRELQAVVQVALLDRSGRAVRPTDAAARLVHFVRLMLAELRAGIDELSAQDQAPVGKIRIGVLPVARAQFLPRVLSEFCSQHPGASVEVIEGPYAELLGRLRQGDMDLLIGSQRASVPARDVVQEGLFDDELVIVGRVGHPLGGKRRLSDADLHRHPWVVPAHGVPMRLNWERMFQVRGQAPPVLRVECGSVLIMRGLMLEGDWLTLMSRDQFLLESQAGRLMEIGSPGADFWRRIAMTRRIDWRPTALQSQFVALLQSVAAQKAPVR